MGNTKRCNTCKETKPISKFYLQKNGMQGRTGSCKMCRREYQKKYHNDNRDKRSEKGKEYRESFPEKQKENRERFKTNNPDYWKEYYKQNREKRLASNKRFYEKHPERKKFYQEYRKALRKGIIEKPNFCMICGTKGKIVGHHFSYDEPLKVTWVCDSCHHDIHRKHRFTKK